MAPPPRTSSGCTQTGVLTGHSASVAVRTPRSGRSWLIPEDTYSLAGNSGPSLGSAKAASFGWITTECWIQHLLRLAPPAMSGRSIGLPKAGCWCSDRACCPPRLAESWACDAPNAIVDYSAGSTWFVLWRNLVDAPPGGVNIRASCLLPHATASGRCSGARSR
jgi:hypothetical protein